MTQPGDASQSQLERLPKIDLHRHLLGSIRPQTLWELCRKYNVDAGRKPLDELTSMIVHRAPTGDLTGYTTPWHLFRQVIRDDQDVWRIAVEAALDARLDGLRYIEFRSSLPGMPITDGVAPQTRIPADAYLQAIRDAFSEVPGIVCRLVASVPRHAVGLAAPRRIQQYAAKFFEVVARFRDDVIVGVDLTGIEHGWPATLFRDVFATARSLGLPVTIHAGETEGPEEIWTAIDDLGASRIGHGTSAPNDARLVDELIKRDVILEVCPTASWLIGGTKDRHRHPIIDCAPPIPYVVCTDNPTLNASTQSNELRLASEIAQTAITSFIVAQFRVALRAAFPSTALAAAASAGGWYSPGFIDDSP